MDTTFVYRLVKGSILISAALTVSTMISCKHSPDSLSATSIIGGVPSSGFPFMAGVVNQKRSPGTASCGGSLIRKNVILTAAHCVARNSSSLYGFLGTTSIETGLGTMVKADAVVVHPDYDASAIKNDLALVFLRDYDVARFAGPVAPITIASSPAIPKSGDQITLIGWGLMTTIGRLKDNALKQLALPVLPDAACKQIYDDFDDAGHTQVCYNNAAAGGGDACNGDSGGPLVSMGAEGTRLIGAVSYGRGICGQMGNPSVATRVGSYADWINTNADYYTRPVMELNGQLLADQIKARCLDSLVSENSDEQNDTQITTYNYYFPQVFAGTQAFASNPALFEAAHCEFSLPVGGQTESFVVSVMAGGGEPHFDVQVGGKKYTAQARVTHGIAIESHAEKTITGRIDAPDDFNNYFIANGVTYATREDLPDNPDNLSSIASCSTPAYSASLLAKSDNTKVLLLKGAPWPSGKRLIRLQEMGRTDSTLAAVFTPKDALNGTFQLVNSGTVDLYSWKMDCIWPFTLTDQNGKSYAPQEEMAPGPTGYSQTLYYHLFDMTKVAQGTVLKGNAATFAYTFQSPLGQYDSTFCSVNGVPVQVTLKK